MRKIEYEFRILANKPWFSYLMNLSFSCLMKLQFVTSTSLPNVDDHE